MIAAFIIVAKPDANAASPIYLHGDNI